MSSEDRTGASRIVAGAYSVEIGRVVGVKGVVVAPSEVQEYLVAVGLNSMDVVRAIGRRRRGRMSEEAIILTVVDMKSLRSLAQLTQLL